MKVAVKTGATWDSINKAVAKDIAAGILADHRAAPAFFPDHTYNETGELVAGFFFQPASRGGMKSGLLGTIQAPFSRFATMALRDGYVRRLHQVWLTKGINFTKAGR